jgi:hypothetical protein
MTPRKNKKTKNGAAHIYSDYLYKLRVGTDSKNLFIGQYDKLFEEYWLSPISYLSPYRG